MIYKYSFFITDFVGPIDLLILIVGLMENRLNIYSTNSSKPPAQDPNRPRKTRLAKGQKRDKKKQGGQVGHRGST